MLVPALDGVLRDRPDPTHVELVVEHARLEWRPLLGQHGLRAAACDAVEDADDAEVILRVALVELLTVRLPDRRASWHEDPRPGAVGAGPPRALRARHATLLVELGRVLADVPDVSEPVLRVPVGRPLAEM